MAEEEERENRTGAQGRRQMGKEEVGNRTGAPGHPPQRGKGAPGCGVDQGRRRAGGGAADETLPRPLLHHHRYSPCPG